MVVDGTIPSDSNIKNGEHEKLKKNQALKEELEKMCGDRETGSCKPQAGLVGPAKMRNNI